MKKKSMALIALCLYLLLLVWLVIFKLQIDPALFPHYRQLILIPFSRPGAANMRTVVFEIVDNFLAFIPLGLLLSAVEFPKKWWERVVTGLCLSIVFEAAQYAFAMGTCDVTDLITNTLGTLAGVLLYIPIKKLLKEKAPFVTGLVILILLIGALAGYLFLTIANL